jgi:hypothetical protein
VRVFPQYTNVKRLAFHVPAQQHMQMSRDKEFNLSFDFVIAGLMSGMFKRGLCYTRLDKLLFQ